MSDPVYAPTYRDELALSHHFIGVLEQQLAGRDASRRTNAHPLDWCHLGVIGPTKQRHVPVELDAAALEAEPAPEGTDTSGAGSPPPKASGLKAVTNTAGAVAGSAKPSGSDEADEPRVVVEKSDDKDSTRRPPSAIGFEVLVEPDSSGEISITINASFCVFTKHLPTWAEQTGVLDSASAGAPLADVVQRWPLAIKDVHIRIPTTGGVFHDDGAVQYILDQALRDAFDSADVERLWPGTRPKVSDDALKTNEAFDAFLASRTSGLASDEWELHASLEVRVTPRPDGKVRVGCYLKNDTPETPPLTKGKGMKDAFKVISDVRVEATFDAGQLVPIEILPVPQDYQYDRRVWAVGHNTSVKADRAAGTVVTAALAVYEQPRIMTRDAVKARFASLAADPFETLDAIFEAMLVYEQDWKQRVLEDDALGLDAAALAECTHDYKGFVDEIRRFACGVAALKADERLLRAFQGANRVFGRLANGYDTWRLFQLVYIVTQLPALAIRENFVEGHYPPGEKRVWKDVLDWGDVLWFRTGGGKTEAYLGHGRCIAATIKSLGYPSRDSLSAWIELRHPQGRTHVAGRVPELAPEAKQSAVIALCMRPASAQAVADEAGVSRGSLYKWKNQLLGHESTAPMKRHQDAPASPDRVELERQVEALQRDIRRLQLEKDLLKKANELLKKNWASTGST